MGSNNSHSLSSNGKNLSRKESSNSNGVSNVQPKSILRPPDNFGQLSSTGRTRGSKGSVVFNDTHHSHSHAHQLQHSTLSPNPENMDTSDIPLRIPRIQYSPPQDKDKIYTPSIKYPTSSATNSTTNPSHYQHPRYSLQDSSTNSGIQPHQHPSSPSLPRFAVIKSQSGPRNSVTRDSSDRVSENSSNSKNSIMSLPVLPSQYLRSRHHRYNNNKQPTLLQSNDFAPTVATAFGMNKIDEELNNLPKNEGFTSFLTGDHQPKTMRYEENGNNKNSRNYRVARVGPHNHLSAASSTTTTTTTVQNNYGQAKNRVQLSDTINYIEPNSSTPNSPQQKQKSRHSSIATEGNDLLPQKSALKQQRNNSSHHQF